MEMCHMGSHSGWIYMDVEQLEKIKELVEKIENIVNENRAIFLNGKLKEFSEAVTFELKNEVWEKYNKETSKEKGINEE